MRRAVVTGAFSYTGAAAQEPVLNPVRS